ncbi:MAG TPA: Ppx/GppA phosphatase family protein [Anaerolineales bacterium]|nr:Ppx/GppA phosphatase family protein [Anaerolineales bacterium]
MTKIAAIDIGSNGMRMVLGQVDEAWQVETVENIRLPVRLGQSVFSKGYLDRKTIKQTEEAFLRFKHMADTFGVERMRAVATSAAREASNSDLLLDRITQVSGIDLEIISGEEEARLIHRAVSHALKVKNKRTLLIDIGGGSIELTISSGQDILSTDSYDMGTVRLLENLDSGGKFDRTFAQLVREYAESARHRIDRVIGNKKIQVCAGTGGNVEEIGQLRQKLLKEDGDRFVMLDELEKIIERISRLDYEQRIEKLNLKPDRADVILPASIVLHMIASEAGVKQIDIPNVGLKDGVLLEIAEELSRSPRPRRRRQAWESALHMGRKYRFDEKHARLTARFASRLFVQSVALHNLDDDDLLILEMAALLHDIGYFIGTVDHEVHGHYLLSSTHLIGLTAREQDMVASLVLNHRKQSHSADEKSLKSLPQKDRLIVSKLLALLRLADSLDISHSGIVEDVALQEAEDGWRIRVSGEGDMMLANWALTKRKSLFEDVFNVSLEVA